MNESDPRPHAEEAVAAVSAIGNLQSEITNSPWFFSDTDAVQRLRDEAATWLKPRTPFRPYSRVKGQGGGTDCVGLCEALMMAVGAVESFSFPRGKEDYSRHVHNDKILNYLRGKADDKQSATLAARFAELPVPERKNITPYRIEYVPALMPGDLLILKGGKGLYHMPIMLDGRTFVQCAFPDGVTTGDFGASNYFDHIVALFRARALPNLKSEISKPQ